ncbi:MAG: type IV pilus twitching motility protein PilT [Candidatus Omnitrophica bacterium]|nr:type IV pilus twitching motility protein PilT [Candidatus Omnitrophota bacterium]
MKQICPLLNELLHFAVDRGASDLHLVCGHPPTLRIEGDLVTIDQREPLNGEQTKEMVYSILNDEHVRKFEEEWELDLSVAIPDLSRFRLNLYISKDNIEAAFRVVGLRVKQPEELGLPLVVAEFCRKPSGLVLVTGPTGVGKTTTMNSMIDLINRERSCRIVIIEDPIEFIHSHKKSVIIQREVYSDTKTFANALKHTLRQDPNVICVGEMRDLETIQTAMIAAETGHLVLATLHTPDAVQTIDRIIDVFPPHAQTQIRIVLSSCIQGVISQQLLPRIDGKGRVLSTEVLCATPALRNVIREAKTEQIPTIIQTSADMGMQLMDTCLTELYAKGIISYETALSRVKDIQHFKAMLMKSGKRHLL